MSDDSNTLELMAWKVREHSRILGKTKVGCALLSVEGNFYNGCNIEHKFRSHDIHAEINAISSMIAGGDKKIDTILIAADRESFTPCGSCMDWIFEMGGSGVQVLFHRKDGVTSRYTAGELMPFYPK